MAAEAGTSPNWVNVQKKTFTRWVNTYLSERMMKVEELQSDLGDGLALIALLEVISSKQVASKYNKSPKLKMQKVENLNFCINFLTQEGIKLVNIDGTDIAEGNLRLILGLIWTIILRYQIQVSEQGSAKAELLAWVRSKIPEYEINNFSRDWADGKAIMALAEAVQPGQFNLPADFSSDAVTNARNGIQSAKDKMSIPDILDPEDMVHQPDELANMTYISYFRDYLDMLERRRQDELLNRTPVAANCIAYGPGLEKGVVAQEETEFTIEARNVHGRKVPVGGHQFDVDIQGPNGNVPHKVTDNGDGTYKVSYTAHDMGNHNIDVKHKGEHIKDSPFSIVINPSLPWAASSGIKSYSFVVQSRDRRGNDKDQGGAKVEVHIQGSGGRQAAKVTDQGDGTYHVEYSLGEKSGNYEVSVTLNGNDVKGTPFTQTVG